MKDNGPTDVPTSRAFDKYSHGGKSIDKEEALKLPVLAIGDGLPSDDTVYAFESKKALAEWAKTTDHAERVVSAIKGMESVEQLRQRDHSYAKQRQLRIVERALKDLTELSQRTGLPLSSPELLMKASHESDPLEEPIFHHSALLWERSAGQGAALPCIGPFPDLNWFGWGNRAVSLNANGVVVLTDNPWYGGQSVWLFGFFWPLFELAGFGFEFRAEAMWS